MVYQQVGCVMCMRNLHETALYEGRHEVKVLYLGVFRVGVNDKTPPWNGYIYIFIYIWYIAPASFF